MKQCRSYIGDRGSGYAPMDTIERLLRWGLKTVRSLEKALDESEKERKETQANLDEALREQKRLNATLRRELEVPHE